MAKINIYYFIVILASCFISCKEEKTINYLIYENLNSLPTIQISLPEVSEIKETGNMIKIKLKPGNQEVKITLIKLNDMDSNQFTLTEIAHFLADNMGCLYNTDEIQYPQDSLIPIILRHKDISGYYRIQHACPVFVIIDGSLEDSIQQKILKSMQTWRQHISNPGRIN